MTVQQPDHNKAAPEPPDSKIFESDKPQLESGPKSPMDKFNKALRKILSVPKKKLKDK